jgi:hypothetical protein
MNGVFDPIVKIWDKMKTGAVATPQVSTIARCTPENSAGYAITRDRMYFEIRVNELNLAENREWWSVYDPMVVVVAEYNYAGEKVARPAVVGPSLIRTQTQTDKPRHGVVLQDSLVVGPHPYRGGNVDISLSFYQVRRTNSASSLLKVIDRLSGALSGPGGMATVAKVGGALLEGVEGLLGLEETVYLAGNRLSLTPSPLYPLTACFSALIAPPVPPAPEQLMVRDRRLYIGDPASAQPYRASDFVLFGLAGSATRGDESSLPFYALKTNALAALAERENGLKRARAAMITAYQQMRMSPDVTSHEASELLEQWMQEFETVKKEYERLDKMKEGQKKQQPSALEEELNAAAARLGL